VAKTKQHSYPKQWSTGEPSRYAHGNDKFERKGVGNSHPLWGVCGHRGGKKTKFGNWGGLGLCSPRSLKIDRGGRQPPKGGDGLI